MAEVEVTLPPHVQVDFESDAVEVVCLGEPRRIIHAERTEDGGLRLRVEIPDEVLRDMSQLDVHDWDEDG